MKKNMLKREKQDVFWIQSGSWISLGRFMTSAYRNRKRFQSGKDLEPNYNLCHFENERMVSNDDLKIIISKPQSIAF